MSIYKNLKITKNEEFSLDETINNISSKLGANWSRENANIENDAKIDKGYDQYAFRYKEGVEDISIWFEKDENHLRTTNITGRHMSKLSIAKCNEILEVFANENLIGREEYEIK